MDEHQPRTPERTPEQEANLQRHLRYQKSQRPRFNKKAKMFRTRQETIFILFVSLIVMASSIRAQETEQSEREAMYYRYLEFASYVKGGSVEPHWMADGSSFWYAEGAPENTVIYKVDPKANTKTELFDTARLRQAVTPLLDHEPAIDVGGKNV